MKSYRFLPKEYFDRFRTALEKWHSNARPDTRSPDYVALPDASNTVNVDVFGHSVSLIDSEFTQSFARKAAINAKYGFGSQAGGYENIQATMDAFSSLENQGLLTEGDFVKVDMVRRWITNFNDDNSSTLTTANLGGQHSQVSGYNNDVSNFHNDREYLDTDEKQKDLRETRTLPHVGDNKFGHVQEYQQLAGGEVIDIDISGITNIAGTSVQMYKNDASLSFIDQIQSSHSNGFGVDGSFKDFDDFFVTLDRVNAAGLFAGNFGPFEDLMRRWARNYKNENSSTLDSSHLKQSNAHSQPDGSNTPFSNSRPYGDNDTILSEDHLFKINDKHNDNFARDGEKFGLSNGRPSSGTKIKNDLQEAEYFMKAQQSGVGITAKKNKNVKTFFQNYNQTKPYNNIGDEDNYMASRRKAIDTDTLHQTINKKSQEIRTLKGIWHDEVELSIRQGKKIGAGVGETALSDRAGNNLYAPSNDSAVSDYMLRFYNAIRSPVEIPNIADQNNLAAGGFNAGQILGSTVFKQRTPNNNRRVEPTVPNTVNEYIRQTLIDSLPPYHAQDTDNTLEHLKAKLVTSYLPGLTRNTQPYYIRAPLDQYLDQNILLPEGSGNNNTDFTPDGIWKKLYQNNRSGAHVYSYAQRANETNPGTIRHVDVFRKGVIAGVAVKEIENQGSSKQDRKIRPLFDFVRDDGRNLTYIAKEMGFISNIPGTVKATTGQDGASDVQGEMPAVEQIKKPLNNLTDIHDYQMKKGDEQYFPFLFQTENRREGGELNEQICYLQATVDSINETFNPAWQGKHFFGRTEQVHTYTHTDRVIDISFSVIATSARQLQNVYERVTWLAQQTYGQMSFDGGGNPTKLSNGPIIRMTIGDMFASMPGFIRSLSYDWNFLGAGGKWEMSQGLRIPMACKVGLSFQVLHDDLPDRGYALYGGPIRRSDGLIGSRGDDDGSYGPLISVNDRDIKLPPIGLGYDDPNAPSVTTTYAGVQKENEMYIDYVARNTSI